MSQGEPMPRDVALSVAEALVVELAPACARIAIAGSLRREKPTVRDIEIVVAPRIVERSSDDIWETPLKVDETEEAIAAMLASGRLVARQVENHRRNGTVDLQTKLGPAFKALAVDGIPLDLFVIRDRASWGVIFGLRTGPGDWNTRLVDQCKAIGRRVAGGKVEAWNGVIGRWEPVPTPEEADFFREVGQAWVEPRDRHPARVRIRRELLAGVPA